MNDPLQLHVEATATFTRSGSTDDDEPFEAIVTHDDVVVEIDCPFDEDCYETKAIFVKTNGSTGMHVSELKLADVLSDRLRDGYEISHEHMTIRLGGTVDEWATFAVERADNKLTVGSDNTVAELAIDILLDLTEYCETVHPYLAAMQLAEDYDTDYTIAALTAEMHDGEATQTVVTPSTEQTATGD